VIDYELASAIEEVGESFLAPVCIENIVLFDFDPGKLAAFDSESVALAGEPLFLGE
jgi:hypothetical protein